MKKVLSKPCITHKQSVYSSLFFILFLWAPFCYAGKNRLFNPNQASKKLPIKRPTSTAPAKKLELDNVETFMNHFKKRREVRKKNPPKQSNSPKKTRTFLATPAQKACFLCTASFIKRRGPCTTHKDPSTKKIPQPIISFSDTSDVFKFPPPKREETPTE